MLSKKLISTVIVSIMLIVTLVPLMSADYSESDSDVIYTTTVSNPNNKVVRSVEPISMGYFDRFVYYFTEKSDENFIKYANGEISYDELNNVKEQDFVRDQLYYVYDVRTYNQDGFVEISKVKMGEPFVLKAGSHTINFVEYPEELSEIEIFNIKEGYSFDSALVSEGLTFNITGDSFRSCRLSTNNNFDQGPYVFEVKYTISSKPVSYGTGEGTKSVCTTTNFAWFKDDIDYSEGALSRSEGIYLETGSESEARFLEDVVYKGKTLATVSLSDYDAYYHVDDLAGRKFTYYVLVDNANEDYVYSYYYYGSDSNHVSHYEAKLKRISDDSLFSFYAAGNKTFTVSVSYDSNLYELYLADGTSYDKELLYIPDGKSLSIENMAAKEYYIEAIYVGPETGDAVFVADFKITLDNAPVADGLSVLFAIVCILLCVLVFAVLFISGFKPSWAKEEE